ncbi:MAG: methionyl-tRNA formyltransferase [Betaproteobacteria bacterium]
MRVIFAGTPEFAARALESILAAGHRIPLVLTQPDRPAGRGQRLLEGPVKRVALAHALSLYQPERLRSTEQQAPVLAVPADVMVVAAYGLILPQVILDHPRFGCLNIHASLLPRWRGAAPIQRALLAGDAETGICVMQMDAGLDTGAVVSRHPVAIAADDTAGSLHETLSRVGAEAIVAALSAIERGSSLTATAQPAEGMTYAPKITKDEARIDWACDADEIARQVRAFNPAPGAFTSLNGEGLKIWRAHPAMIDGEGGAPGQIEIRDAEMLVGCRPAQWLAIDEIQHAGGRRMSGATYAIGHKGISGSRLGT